MPESGYLCVCCPGGPLGTWPLLPSACHFLALRVEISLVHYDLTRQTVPKAREEPLCRSKLCLNRDICVRAVLVGHGGLGRCYLVTCHFLALRVEISLVHDDLTRQTVPKAREEPLCRSKLCLNRDICVCAVLVGHWGHGSCYLVTCHFLYSESRFRLFTMI